ncbi:hypothetical protein FA09DRAFT_34680 [Tilletiopsis washingtonensis]|uniref:Uncharacterized protein n=1 Tax=Tilletiopsis washingtonensis TaxID=58919 RepID=A0A316Z862_9BASI|nr:hypothetical protein FA09DRAFT_34680 [Tilletiopsis washingtonensis]PWN97977.1 hypothetical protein FA09DRAFT_34680 [Tilletiopsis washingtonensis]
MWRVEQPLSLLTASLRRRLTRHVVVSLSVEHHAPTLGQLRRRSSHPALDTGSRREPTRTPSCRALSRRRTAAQPPPHAARCACSDAAAEADAEVRLAGMQGPASCCAFRTSAHLVVPQTTPMHTAHALLDSSPTGAARPCSSSLQQHASRCLPSVKPLMAASTIWGGDAAGLSTLPDAQACVAASPASGLVRPRARLQIAVALARPRRHRRRLWRLGKRSLIMRREPCWSAAAGLCAGPLGRRVRLIAACAAKMRREPRSAPLCRYSRGARSKPCCEGSALHGHPAVMLCACPVPCRRVAAWEVPCSPLVPAVREGLQASRPALRISAMRAPRCLADPSRAATPPRDTRHRARRSTMATPQCLPSQR